MSSTTQDQIESRRVMNRLLGGIEQHVFMVRDKKTGLWATDDNPPWGKYGKVWRAIGFARSNITRNQDRISYQRADAEVVEIELLPLRTHPPKRIK